MNDGYWNPPIILERFRGVPAQQGGDNDPSNPNATSSERKMKSLFHYYLVFLSIVLMTALCLLWTVVLDLREFPVGLLTAAGVTAASVIFGYGVVLRLRGKIELT